MKKNDLADEEGNSLNIDPASDVGQLTTLLEYCRIRGFRIGPYVKLGGIECQVRDVRQREDQKDRGDADEPDIFEQHGYVRPK